MNKYTQTAVFVMLILISVLLAACSPAPEAQETATAAAEQVAVNAAVTEPQTPNDASVAPPAEGMGAGMGGEGMGGAMGAGMGMGFGAFPPPAPKDGRTRDEYIAEGTMAPDGIGVTVRNAATNEVYTEENVTYVPWEDASTIKPLTAGTPLPAGLAAFQKSGDKFDLNASVAGTPTVVIYYRGGWCPYCNAHMQDLQGTLPALQAMGYQLLAISTDTVEALQAYDDSELDYQLLADPDLSIATALGIKYKVVKEYIDHVKAIPADRAFDMEERNGGYLVTPGAFVMDTKGVVRFSYANNNYAVRVSEEALLNAAREALND